MEPLTCEQDAPMAVLQQRFIGMDIQRPVWGPENKKGMSVHHITKCTAAPKINPRGTINKSIGLSNYLLFSSLQHVYLMAQGTLSLKGVMYGQFSLAKPQFP